MMTILVVAKTVMMAFCLSLSPNICSSSAATLF